MRSREYRRACAFLSRTSRSGSPRRDAFPNPQPLSLCLSLSVPSISPPPLLLFPFPLHALRTHPAWHVRACACVCRESNDGNETLSSTISRKVIHDEFPKVEEVLRCSELLLIYSIPSAIDNIVEIVVDRTNR